MSLLLYSLNKCWYGGPVRLTSRSFRGAKSKRQCGFGFKPCKKEPPPPYSQVTVNSQKDAVKDGAALAICRKRHRHQLWILWVCTETQKLTFLQRLQTLAVAVVPDPQTTVPPACDEPVKVSFTGCLNKSNMYLKPLRCASTFSPKGQRSCMWPYACCRTQKPAVRCQSPRLWQPAHIWS